jgi:hypothetical protein
MASIKHYPSAIIDLIEAKKIIEEYFLDKQEPLLAGEHLKAFQDEFEQKENALIRNPEMYAIRTDGFFTEAITPIRSFKVHWFTVFYTYNESSSEVYIWYIRPSRSDLSKVLYLFNS